MRSDSAHYIGWYLGIDLPYEPSTWPMQWCPRSPAGGESPYSRSVSIQRASIAGLTTHVVDVVPRHTRKTPDHPEPLVTILLHGFGAHGDDLVGLAQVIDAATTWVFPAAPLRLGGPYGDGRAWWPLDLAALEARLRAGAARVISDEVPPGLPEVRAQLTQLVVEVSERFAVTPDRIALGGFSQGAMLALDVALHTPVTLAGVILLSGTLVAGSEWTPRLPTLANRPVFQSHGRHDPLLPFAVAELLRDRLRNAGARVDWHPFDGGHAIPPNVLGSLADFLCNHL